MRKIIIAGNWKMYKCKDEALEFIFKINDQIPDRNQIETIIFPQTTLLDALTQIEGKNLRIGAQNVFYQNEGPYTGEVSPSNIYSLGVKYILLGHSERRVLFQETDELVNLKLLSVLNYPMYPIVCLGENQETKNHQKVCFFLHQQLEKILKNVNMSLLEKIIFAYEPIWAIGTGNNIPPAEANIIIKTIRKKIASLYSFSLSEKVRIIYGGSVNNHNISSFLEQTEIDGILSGSCSLEIENFLFFIQVANQKIQKMQKK